MKMQLTIPSFKDLQVPTFQWVHYIAVGVVLLTVIIIVAGRLLWG